MSENRDTAKNLATVVGLPEDYVRAARLPEATLREMFATASTSKKRVHYLMWPAAVLFLGCSFGSLFTADFETKNRLGDGILGGVLLYVAAAFADKRPKVRSDIRSAADARLIALDKRDPQP